MPLTVKVAGRIMVRIAGRLIPLRRIRRRFIVALGMALAASCASNVIDVAPPPPPPPPPATITVSPATVAFSDTVGTATPGARVTIDASRRAALALGAITYGPGASGWLTASLDSSTAPTALALVASVAGLVSATYTASVPIESHDAANSPQVVSVTLAVSAAPAPPPPPTPPPPPPPPPQPGVAVVIAGNIASCTSSMDEATAALIDSLSPGNVITAGDNAFPNGTADDYGNCYGPSWGRFKEHTYGVLGNHDYNTGTATAAFDYWAATMPRDLGYYSVTIGAWHVVLLNDNIDVSPGSPQLQWLRADLAAHNDRCTMAVWHQPLFLSSNTAGFTERPTRRPLWNLLYNSGVDLVVTGHQHHYERMAPMAPDGTRDDVRGIVQINVGTGGESVETPTVAVNPNSVVRAGVFGVLLLNLRADGYDWRFVPAPGSTFTDAGSSACH